MQVPLSLWPEAGRQGSDMEWEFTHTEPTDRLWREEEEREGGLKEMWRRTTERRRRRVRHRRKAGRILSAGTNLVSRQLGGL